MTPRERKYHRRRKLWPIDKAELQRKIAYYKAKAINMAPYKTYIHRLDEHTTLITRREQL